MLVRCPAVGADSNNPIARYGLVIVPGVDVGLAHEDDVWWDCPPTRVDALDHCCPHSIAWLDQLGFSTSVRTRDDQLRRYDTHHEAGLVKVKCVLVEDAILLLC